MGARRLPDYGESSSIVVADYLIERGRVRPGADDVLDEVSGVELRASDIRVLIDGFISCRHDLRRINQARFRARPFPSPTKHELVPTDAQLEYHVAVCSCGVSGRVVDRPAAEVWHAMHVRWPADSAAELATRMRDALRHPSELRAPSGGS